MGIMFLNNKGIVSRKVNTLIKKQRRKKMKMIKMGDEKVTRKQYQERVSFLLNEILEFGLLEFQKDLEKLYDQVSGDELYEIQCKVGDYIYNLKQ